jgi:hyaluronoglucosaminidase
VTRRWLGAVEAFYGVPFTHDSRLELLAWLAGHGFNCYAYAPKDDPYHRARWRVPYPHEDMARLGELVARGTALGIDVALALSPGLDWKAGDEDALVAKLRTFRDVGATVLAIAFDDVPPGGADLGDAHGRAVAAAVEGVGDDIAWVTCPTDYATPVATPYLEAYVARLPEDVDVMWTGPAIVTPRLTGADARRVSEPLGRGLLFAENFPVNDGAMSGVLHLGPYPERSPDVVDATSGVFCNLMPRARASRVGLAGAAAFWREPTSDREEAWKAAVAEEPGLLPLARACRAWAGDVHGLDSELDAWVDAALAGDDGALTAYLQGGCRQDLDPALAAEIEPWLTQWDAESHAMQFALQLLRGRPGRPADIAFVLSELWRRARNLPMQVFGTRWAYYPVTTWSDGRFHALPDALVQGENLTDRLCRLALTGTAD